MSRVERLRREKITRYSIRKYSFGAASVAVAALFMFLGNGAVSVQADEIQSSQIVESTDLQAEKVQAKPTENVTPVAEVATKPVEVTIQALDKTQLESYIADIEAKLANGFYDNKTEESVALLKNEVASAKSVLETATSQDQLSVAYRILVTTTSSKLKNKPVEKKRNSCSRYH